MPEISGSVPEDDLAALAYCYSGDDIYFCVGTIDDGFFLWGATLIFKYSSDTNVLAYYSWIDTSELGVDTPYNVRVFDLSEDD